MTSPPSLPTPEQIAHAPELVALHALMHVLELTTRALVAAHPDLDNPEAPYWVAPAGRRQRSALRIANNASRLKALIEGHLAQLSTCYENSDFDLDEDLPF